MSAPGKRKMTHPASEQEITVSADVLEMFESQGWQMKSATDKPDPGDK